MKLVLHTCVHMPLAGQVLIKAGLLRAPGEPEGFTACR